MDFVPHDLPAYASVTLEIRAEFFERFDFA